MVASKADKSDAKQIEFDGFQAKQNSLKLIIGPLHAGETMKTKAEKIAELKAEIERLEKEPETVWARFEPAARQYYFVPVVTSESCFIDCKFLGDKRDQRAIGRGMAFETPEQAAAVADAMIVMCQLRRCEGAGQRSDCARSYIWVNPDYRGIDLDDDTLKAVSRNFVVPVFPTEELCQAAIKKVGRDRVIAAIKLWAMVDA